MTLRHLAVLAILIAALSGICCAQPVIPQRQSRANGPPVRTLVSFEEKNPFGGGTVVAEHATDGRNALRVDKGAAVMAGSQDWSSYDYLKVDTYTDADQPVAVTVEIRDSGTTGYWTRVNYPTVLPPGKSTLTLVLAQLFVGEKSHPGRHLIVNQIRRFVLNFEKTPPKPVFFDNLRLERDTTATGVFFEGLHAFDFGPAGSPVMDGFTAITPATVYDPRRGYGLKDAKIWRAFDVFEPDPLYQDFLAIESGGLAVDVPNGKCRVFVNMDGPGGFWGDVQNYRERTITAQGRTVVSDTMDFRSFQKKYFQFWDRDDLPSDNTFDKYDRARFAEKVFNVNVTNGRPELGFNGQNRACSVSAVIVFSADKAAEGARFLDWVREKRRFYFDNSFKRVLHRGTGDPLAPTAADKARGYVLFFRDYMEDVSYNDTPRRGEAGQTLTADAFPGEAEPVTVSVVPLRDLGKVTVTAGALSGPGGSIPATAVDFGYVSYRLSRVSNDGSVYEITPRLVLPLNRVKMPRGITRRFWLTVNVPAAAAPGVYEGQLTVTSSNGSPGVVPVHLRVRKGALADTDIPVGPFGGPMKLPWLPDDPAAARFDGDLPEKALRMLRAWKFTMFNGVPYVVYGGFQSGKPVLDFSAADRQMQTVRKLGFLAVSSYGAGVMGLDAYHIDTAKMKAAGFSDYSAFLKAIYTAIQEHADARQWPTVYWNLGDEPIGPDALKRSADNAQAYHSAFPAGPPRSTAATSLGAQDPDDLHFHLASALEIPALNAHSASTVRRLRSAGSQWAFYNAGSRWTFGEYLYKAAKEFQLQYRLAWHWNNAAGDPYYALDCREDDYAWGNAAPGTQLTLSVEFFRIAAGLTDYRYLLTLARLSRQKAGQPAADSAARWIGGRMAAFQLGDTDRAIAPGYWRAFREEAADAIEALSR